MSEEAPQKKGGLGMIVVAIVALLAGGGGGAGATFLMLSRAAAEAEAQAAAESESSEPTPEEVAAEFEQRLLPLEPIVANITSDGYSRLLKVTVELLCESPEVRGEAEARKAQLRDAILTVVSSKRLVDVSEFEGKAFLKEELRDRLNQILESGSIESVLSSDFVVQ